MQQVSIDEYHKLKDEFTQKGYFKRAYLFYFEIGLLILMGFSLSIFILYSFNSMLIQLLNALFMAFLTVQSGMLGHDMAHGQVFKSEKVAWVWSSFFLSFVSGVGQSFWHKKHNDHHKDVNHLNHDPDVEIPFVFTDRHPNMENGYFIRTFILPYQHIIFFLALPLVYFGLFIDNMKQIYKVRNAKGFVDLLLVVLHFAFLFYIIFTNLSVGYGIIFLFVFLGAGGVYMSLVFAPNHKGMEVISEHEKMHWTHQIICTRNLCPNTAVFYLLGGLNFQIEHHLFPGMPRINYLKIQRDVKAFCQKHNISYYETTWVGSMSEIYLSLKTQAKKALVFDKMNV